MHLIPRQIPGADLDGGLFDGCTFEAADLTGCSLRNASLRRCDLTHAKLGAVDLGVLPPLYPFRRNGESDPNQEEIGRVEVSTDGDVAVLLSGDGRSAKVRPREHPRAREVRIFVWCGEAVGDVLPHHWRGSCHLRQMY